MSILEDLFDGNINPAEKYIKKDSDCYKLNEQLNKYTDDLISSLTEEEKKLFEKIEDTIYNINRIYEKEFFAQGFRLGTQIIYEALNYESSDFIH